MNLDTSDLDRLWLSAPRGDRAFDPGDFAHLPAPVQRYLAHSITPGTPLASAVRLRMHGAIRLSRWWPFKAEQVIVGNRGMIWCASAHVRGMSISGFDRFLDGAGVMRWALFGLLPMMRASGADITRSAAGRFAAELMWLPSMLCGHPIAWSAEGPAVAHARFSVDGQPAHLAIALNQGRLQSVALRRWGNPDRGGFRDIDFGAIVEQEASFGGYTIPARLRVGWYFGSERFESEGDFLHVTINEAVYR